MEGHFSKITFKSLNFDDLKFTIKNDEFTKLNLLYRGEGNDNLVLQLSQVPFVFRFYKSNVTINVEEENEKIVSSFIFQYLFIRSFFGNYSWAPVIANVDISQIQKLNAEVYHQRPNFRQNKQMFYNGMEIYPDCAFLPAFKDSKCTPEAKLLEAETLSHLRSLLSDQFLKYRNFVFNILNNANSREDVRKMCNSDVETISIEIKPKQGWTASDSRKPLCAYCMNQYLKLRTHKIHKKSEYCPLDLFSGDIRRMKKALQALLKSPQNNLRLFKEGKLVYSEENVQDLGLILIDWFQLDSLQKNIDNFSYLVQKVLLGEWTYHKSDVSVIPQIETYIKSQPRVLCPEVDLSMLEQAMSSNPCKLDCNLPAGSILGRILRVQKLDNVGIETAYDYLRTHENMFSSNFGYVHEMISNIKIAEVGDRLHSTKLNVAQAYLLSALAKDLSIFIAMKPLSKIDSADDGFVVSDERGVHYLINVSVVDVGPKPASCIEKHWQRDRKIITTCARFLCSQAIFPVSK